MQKSNPPKSKFLFALCIITGIASLLLLPVNLLDQIPVPGQTRELSNRDISSYKLTTPYQAPSYLVCSIDDDPEDYNSQGVYHPLDLAVTVSNLRKLNIKHLFLGTHLHWPDVDSQENGALNSAISDLDSCIVSVPLRRSASGIPLPSYLSETSVSSDTIKGNLKLLPQVNNISLAPTFVIPGNTVVGFSQLETELSSSKIPLIAQWEDRVILSSLLLERMHHLNILPADLDINLGEQILLGNSGNIIPIDEFGYFNPSEYPEETKPDIISATITGVEKSPIDTPNAILTAAGLKADSFRAINQPVIKLDQLNLTPVVSDLKPYKRLQLAYQLIALSLISFLLLNTMALEGKKRLSYLLLLTLFTFVAASIIARTSSHYLVTTHILIAIGIALVFPHLKSILARNLESTRQRHFEFEQVANSLTESKDSAGKAKKASEQRKLERNKAKTKKAQNTATPK